MGIQVPEAAPDQPQEAPPVKKEERNLKKSFLVITLLAVVATAVALVAVLPDWEGDDNNGNGEPSENQAALFYELSEGPFDVRVPLFNKNVAIGYTSSEDAKEDLKELAKSLLNVGINNNYYGMPDHMMFDDSMLEGTSAGAPTADAADSEALADATDFSTNNHEFNVDKADFAKSDGTYLFAAYGDYLIVWTVHDLQVVAELQMPPIESSNPTNQDVTDDWGWWQPKPNIQALLLDDSRLTVVVSGYSSAYTEPQADSEILYDYFETQLRVYDINEGDLQLVSTADIHGSFRNAYSVGENVHVVTQAGINVWDHLLEPVQRWHPRFEGLEHAEYVWAAKKYAEDHLIDSFAEKLSEVFEEMDVARFALFVDSISPDGSLNSTHFADGIPNSLTQVVSFDMSEGEVSDEPGEVSVHISGTLQTGSWGQVYATQDMIIVADQGWGWMGWGEAEKTYLLGFRLDGASSTHSVVGTVDGGILNPNSLDFVVKDGTEYLRVATTQNFGFWGAVDVMEDGTTEEENFEEPESSTLNQIIVLKVPDVNPGEEIFEHVGNVTLGKPNERFTTVRFFDEFAYAVTFERTDPFYVVDLADPNDPQEVGALEVTGFSEYLHPIDSNNQYLAAVGQHADEEGLVLGLQISLFDASDPSKPELLNRLVIEDKEDQWSSSSVSWDARAFRFLSLGERTGKLIIPVTNYGWSMVDEDGMELENPKEHNFEGFSVFDISNDVISEEFDIDHSSQNMTFREGCYHYGWLAERSFVFSGDVMTMRGYSVVSTDLTTGTTEGRLNLNELGLSCDM